MNLEDFRIWQDGVMEHIHSLDILVNDRKLLKQMFEEHLSQFFDWDDIEYDREFNKITLLYKENEGAVIKSENMKDLHMDWIVSPDIDKYANRIIRIELYPFGLPED